MATPGNVVKLTVVSAAGAILAELIGFHAFANTPAQLGLREGSVRLLVILVGTPDPRGELLLREHGAL